VAVDHSTLKRWVIKYAASHAAVAALLQAGKLPNDLTRRTNRYGNNAIEHDHRRVKQRV